MEELDLFLRAGRKWTGAHLRVPVRHLGWTGDVRNRQKAWMIRPDPARAHTRDRDRNPDY